MELLNLNDRAASSLPLSTPWRLLARRLLSSLNYLFNTEVHVYAFSIAANALLSFFPFTLLLLTICGRWAHWEEGHRIMLLWLRASLPAGADFVVRNLLALSQGRARLQFISLLMLLFTGSGIFTPLEIALNKVWRLEKNRDFLTNQSISFVLAVVAGVLVLLTIWVLTLAERVLRFSLIDPPHGRGASVAWVHLTLGIVSLPCIVAILFAIYYLLPHGSVRAAPALAASILVAVLFAVGRVVYTVTLPLFRFRQVYGPFALSATLLVWAFAAALTLLWGAQLSARVSVSAPSQGELPLK